MLRRETDILEAEVSPFQHRYLIKRPVIKDYLSSSRPISLQNIRVNRRNGSDGPVESFNGDGPNESGSPIVENRRFELFIDLIWVGIIGNLAEHYSEQAFTSESDVTVGEAFGEFIILFLIAARMWKNLQEFMIKYHTNDFMERIFLIIYLALAALYGNNAVYLLDAKGESNTAIVVYLISKGSITLVEAAYSFFLPTQRRGIAIRLCLVGWPTLAFFISSCFVRPGLKATLLSIGVVLEFVMASFIDTPIFERWLKDERARPYDADHWIERIQDFFIIILGDGVLNLIRGSPLGEGLSRRAGAGIISLCLYYMLSSLFFNGDGSRKRIQAVKRIFWRRTLYMFFHSGMFLSTLVIGVSAMFLIQHPVTNAVKQAPSSPESSGEKLPTLKRSASNEMISSNTTVPVLNEEAIELARFIYNAKWSTSLSLSYTILSLSVIALLSRALDEPKSLMITNRYVRLAPRIGFVVVALCIPIDRDMIAINYLGILTSGLLFLTVWELSASLERSGGIVEP